MIHFHERGRKQRRQIFRRLFHWEIIKEEKKKKQVILSLGKLLRSEYRDSVAKCCVWCSVPDSNRGSRACCIYFFLNPWKPDVSNAFEEKNPLKPVRVGRVARVEPTTSRLRALHGPGPTVSVGSMNYERWADSTSSAGERVQQGDGVRPDCAQYIAHDQRVRRIARQPTGLDQSHTVIVAAHTWWTRRTNETHGRTVQGITRRARLGVVCLSIFA